MAKASPAPTTIQVKLRLNEPLYDAYAERAAKHGRDAEEEMVLRLRNCRDHVASLPIYLNDDQRNELSQITGRAIAKPSDIIEWARRMATITVADIRVDLGERLLQRLASRRFGHPMDEHVRKTVIEQLEIFCGMR